MKYAGETFYLVINEGEILDVFTDDEEAEGMANGINERNTDSECREAGYDPEELTDNERAQFAVSAGYNNGYAYSFMVTIPEEPNTEDYDEESDEDEDYFEEVADEEDVIYTPEGDEFSYTDIISAIESAMDRHEADEVEDEDY